ncbi:MAG TPA: valine--tRNA ligase [Patescibacteria group bacterium]
MDKTYNHKSHEEKIYAFWESKKAFKPGKGTPYTILMPPPNANASLHAGHAMYTVDDILVRWKRMQGYSALWIPGLDHAGFETQFVYEKNLSKEGKSRMDYDRQTLYDNIFKFVKQNSGLIFEQMKRLGFSADWERALFTLDDNVLETVFKTFEKMYKDGYVYRDTYLVNYCVHDGTTLADLEVKHEERKDPLYYINYPFANNPNKFITVATVRPETIFGDVAVAVNPKDKRYKDLIGKKVLLPLIEREIPIITDESVDIEFGTGALKITPAHDPNDFEVAKKHSLSSISIIDLNGRLTKGIPEIIGKKVSQARLITIEKLQEKKYIAKVDKEYLHSVTVCYKCKHELEPTIMPNWFIKVKELKNLVKKTVTEDKVKFYPKKYKNHMIAWLDVMHDWPISRQIVWGIRIPVWYKVDPTASNIYVWYLDSKKKLKQGNVREFLEKGVKIEEIEKGLQKVSAISGTNAPDIKISKEKPTDGMYLPETDTFDTWFSSGQWPLVTLKDAEFETRFPTQVLGTLSDILKFWISRMIMFSLYNKNEVPFKDVYLWSMVADAKGVKMSKSKGNVINPLDLIDKYGADALRMSLMYGTPAGSKVILSDDKVRGMRNFTNKVWNAARFVSLNYQNPKEGKYGPSAQDQVFYKKLDEIKSKVTSELEKYNLSAAAETVYDNFWHWYCDVCIENAKNDNLSWRALKDGLNVFLKLLHPFMPFVTESIWQELKLSKEEPLLINSSWPKAS